MSVGSAQRIGEGLGVDRVLIPPGALPQPAECLDPSGPVRPREFELAVERLCLDATSFGEIRSGADGDPPLIAARILEIVAARGKMHNPVTDSGGVALGTVTAVGGELIGGPQVGDRVVALASLTLTPLRLERVGEVDPASAQVPVSGVAYLPERAPWGLLPDDLPTATAVEIYDVYAAASHTRELLPPQGSVCVLGAGHAGKLALAAAGDAGRDLTRIVVDHDPAAVAAVTDADLCEIGIVADLRDPIATLEALAAAGAEPAELTVVVVSAAGCEPAAITLTAPGGTVLFFSMATRFQTAALTADGMSRDLRMLIGSGYAADSGAYALDLYRSSAALRQALGGDAA